MFESEIKTALKSAGLSEDLWTKITVKTVDEIAGAITQLKADTNRAKSYSSEELADALKTAGLDDAFKKALQSETDRRVTDAIKTHDEKLKQDAKDALKKKDEAKIKDSLTPEEKRIQALEDANKALMEKFDGLTLNLSTRDLDSKIRAELKKAGLPEDFASDVRPENSEKIAEAVATLKGKLDAFHQTGIDAKLAAGDLAPVKKGQAGATLEATQIADYAKSLGKGGAVKNPDFPGKLSSPEPAVKSTVAT